MSLSITHQHEAAGQSMTHESSSPEKLRSAYVAGLIALAGAGLVWLWFAYDSRVPTTDEAGHILNALDCQCLLRHAKPFRADWWPRLLTINSFYPPFVYIFNGFLKLVFGRERAVDVLSVLLFSGVLTLSTFAIAKFVSRSLLAASLAGILINLYPLIANLSHSFMLDFPLTAMIAAGLCSLIWWREKPSWPRCMATGTVLAMACMTKQIAAAYLLLPGVWCLVLGVIAWRKTKQPTQLLQVLAIGACVVAAVAPWALLNWHWIHNYSLETQQHMRNAGVRLTAFGIAADYLVGLYHSMSPLLCGAFLLSLPILKSLEHRRLLPVYLCAIGGLALISNLTWTFPLDRYASGVLIATAVVTAYGGAILVEHHRKIGVSMISVVLALSFYQLLSFSYAPYPMQALPLPNLSKQLGVQLREFRGVRIDKITPYPDGLRWSQSWVLKTIKSLDGAAPVFLNILPSDGIFNPHSFELLARESGMQMKPTTSRLWTIVGDDVTFSPVTALYYQWYLLKTGFQGNKLKDQRTEAEYAKLQSFVRNSGKFRLIGQRQLPDGSSLFLYRQL